MKTPLTDAQQLSSATSGRQLVPIEFARDLETENRRLTDLLDSACAAAGMLPMEPGRHQLLVDWVQVHRNLQDS